MTDAETLYTSRVAVKAGVNVQTIRFYERRGLLAAPERSGSGYREYSPEAVRTVRFIKRAQELGFSLREVGELLALRDKQRSCGEVKRAAAKKLKDVDTKLARLQAMRSALSTLVDSCATGSSSECPLLEALDSSCEA
jgi:Hg(II)-responsive transcriptional regulator